MMACKLFVFFIFTAMFFCCVDSFNLSSIKHDIDFINSEQSLWKADYNSLSSFNWKVWKNKLGIRLIPRQLKRLKKFGNRFSFTVKSSASSRIPQNYDLRKAWPACKPVISLIRDQSACGSCWAVASASVFSDRYCIRKKGAFSVPLSAEDLMRCCSKCKNSNGNGCDGGDVVEAMFHMMDYGIVTGGEYNSKKGCLPYSFAPCSPSDKDGMKGTCAYAEKGAKTEKCQKQCSNSKYKRLYSEDKRFIDDAYIYSSNNEKFLQEEIMKNGSCIATMNVYEDFIHYKSGVYSHIAGKKLGAHGVRLIGWGVERGMKYWLAANSWGPSWGNRGFFKIHRTKNECKFGNIICPFL